MAADRLSGLPDRVLLRVLSFLHAGDTARTSALSRRWGALWRQADAVNVDTDSYWGVGYDGQRAGRLLFRDALAAVHAAGGRCPVRKLSVEVISDVHMDFCQDVMRTSPGLDAVLAAPAVQRLEELRFRMFAEFNWTCDYVLPTSRLPCRCLRVLNLAGCTLGSPGAAVFGRLDTLRLVLCSSSPANLQATLDAAPCLASLWLEHLSLTAEELGHNWYDVMSKRRVLLRCPQAVVAVALLHCHGTDGLDLDAPNVRVLRYKGFLEHFPFASTTTPASGLPMNLQHVELGFCSPHRCCNPPSSENPPHTMFWESIRGFSRLRFLKLKLLDISDIAVRPEQEGTFLKVFPDLKFLEVKGSYEVDEDGAAVAIANLLHCCPAVQELRLRFKLHGDLNAFPNRIYRTEERKAQLELEESMESLKRLKSKTSTAVDDDRCVDMDLSELKERSFPCLDSRLRKIRLEFQLECFKCFAVKIAKFLVENAVVLEEMEVHDGHQRVYDHIHHKLAIWRANASKSRINIVGGHTK